VNSKLTFQRCFNHVTREVVARCPECKKFFCRECITEHDDRVVCTACLKKLTHAPSSRRFAFAQIIRFAAAAAAIFIAWFFFYLIGDLLLKIPASVHEGTLWKTHWIDQP
jgi:hypothetical protein